MRSDSDSGAPLPSPDPSAHSPSQRFRARQGSCDASTPSVHPPGMNGASSDSFAGSRSSALGDNASVMSVDVPSAHASAPAMASQDDQRLHNVGMAALATVGQFPHVVNEESGSLLVSEVVNAVGGGAVSSHPFAMRDQDAEGNIITGYAGMVYSFSDVDSVSEEPGLFSPRPWTGNDVSGFTPGYTVQELIEHTAIQNMARVERDSDSDDDYGWRDMAVDYEPAFGASHTSPSTNPDDELEDFIRFYPGEAEYYQQRIGGGLSRRASMGDVDLDEFYDRVHYGAVEAQVPGTPPMGPFPTGDDQPEPGLHPESIIHTATYERNLSIDEFIERWMIGNAHLSDRFRSENTVPSALRPLAKMIHWEPPAKTRRPDNYKRSFFDLQQIPWDLLKATRTDARELRDAWYTSYHNLDYSRIEHAERLPREETYFREKSMHTAHKATVEHFQLRNLMAVPAYNTVHFASRSRVYSWTPDLDDFRCLIDLTRPSPESGFLGAVKISSMKTAHGLTIAGGFCGEYALRSIDASGSGAKGLVTPDFNDGITNHVDIIRNRTGRSPICVFASNDRHLRVLDCETNIFLSDQELSRPINCTATSPDGRLRVVIGDSPDAWVIEADTGRPVHPLRGHRDFGFACAWSPDMRHIATSNQDKTVIIWDARTWRPLATIDSDVAGYRSLRFSPVGGGPRTLLACEPADRISVIDAQLFQSRQVHDFFGEIGGADYTPDGGAIWVANTDPHFGGFLEFERCQWGRAFGVSDLPNEWVREEELDGDERCVLGGRERGLRFLRGLSEREFDAFVL